MQQKLNVQVINMPAKPVVLCILDGWGDRADAPDNAITQADTPFWDSHLAHCPKSLLETSGLAVGLPEGQMGNSEVGHMNIGSGRVIMQNLPKIDAAIADNSLKSESEITSLIANLKKTGGACHILGLMSPGGVHSHQKHIAELAKIIAAHDIKVKIHAFLDGRDVAPASAEQFLNDFTNDIENNKNIEIATISGRYYAMDRDSRWDRVQLAYDAMILGKGDTEKNYAEAIKTSYENNVMDEFFIPTALGGYQGAIDGDGLIMANFRSDRARQMLATLVDPDFDGFTSKKIKFCQAVGMVEYSDQLNKFIDAIFKSATHKNILSEVLCNNGLTQLKTAETEKYAHVTFFFNGGLEALFEGEERILVPSPKVATYDLQPEMSAAKVTDNLIEVIEAKKFDFIAVNFANTDMVGHTGVKSAAIKAVETIDKCLERLVKTIENKGGVVFITADHGNSEQMINSETGQPHTSHTTNPVPFVMAGANVQGKTLNNGRLCDIAPTLLNVLGIKKPQEMTGVSLLNG